MLIQFLWLLPIHWIGDFVLQSHWMAQNKSKSFDALGDHVFIYMIVLFVGVCVISSDCVIALEMAATNGILHFVTDYFTSRWTARYFGNDWHTFFVVMGLDQLIHHVTLGATVMVFFK